MAKLNIPICLIDESVVDYGFRVLMSGCQLDSFKKNPVLLLQHKRPDDYGSAQAGNDVVLPLGKWHDLQIDGGRLVGMPEFDDDDELAVKVEKKVEKGYLNAASIWIDPISVSDDDALKLPGQSGPTITKWGIREASIVDIPNCRNALAIRNSAGKKITLNSSDQDTTEILQHLRTFLPQKNTTEMDNKLLAAKLGLDENAADAAIATKLATVLADANKFAGIEKENEQLKTKLVELQEAATNAKVESLIDGAIAAKKLAAGDRERYIKLAKADFDTTSELIGAMKPYQPIESQLGAQSNANANEVAELCKLSGKELWKQGKLDRLKDLDNAQFKLKYKEAFGVEFKN